MGTIVHYGNSSPSGHYVSYCRSDIDNKFYKFDDANIKESSYEELINVENKDIIEIIDTIKSETKGNYKQIINDWLITVFEVLNGCFLFVLNIKLQFKHKQKNNFQLYLILLIVQYKKKSTLMK